MRFTKTSLTLVCFAIVYFSCESRSSRELKSRSSNESHSSDRNDSRSTDSRAIQPPSSERNVVRWRDDNGVKIINIEINGVAMDFIFDTGASIISISATEALFLIKQGTLTEEDKLGTRYYTDAEGEVSEGTAVLLRTVKIGSRVLYDVEASIVHNPVAPLLLGQSALGAFGKISIDNVRQEIVFE
jgi:aspartyl protease family protein